MPDIKYPKNSNSDTVFVEDGGQRTRAVKVAQPDGTIDYPKNPNSDSCYVTVDGEKQRALMVVDLSTAGTIDYPTNPNSTKGYVTINGKKQRVSFTANIAGGSGPTPPTPTGPVIEKAISGTSALIGGGTFIDLTGVSSIKRYVMAGAYIYSTSIGAVSLSPVQTLEPEALYFAFAESTVTTIDMSTVTTLGESAIMGMCVNCTALTSINLNGVNVIEGQQGAQYGTNLNPFCGCTHLEDVYLGGLTASTFSQSNNRLNYLFDSNTGSAAPNGCTVHFPSNFDPDNPDKTYDASTLQGYPYFNGSPYIKIAYDLPATE